MTPSQTAPAKSSISFIVPALNEEDQIEGAVQTIQQAVSEMHLADYEIIMINDGSTDHTGGTMERLASDYENVTVFHNENNLGLGRTYKRGLDHARCDYLMLIPGDNVMPASDMRAILGHLGEADIILPYLINPRLRPLGRRIGSWGFTAVVNLLFGLRVRYFQGVLPRRIHVNKITIQTTSYAFQAEVAVKLIKAGCSYVEVGIENTPSRRGSSVALQPKRLLSVFKGILLLHRAIRQTGAVPDLGYRSDQNR